jgi:putative hydrolase of the HAD superfamily
LNGPLLELIRQLHLRGIKIGVLSNTGSTLRDSMRRHGITDLFDAHIFSADYGVVKPEPQIFDIAADQSNVPKDRTLFFRRPTSKC